MLFACRDTIATSCCWYQQLGMNRLAMFLPYSQGEKKIQLRFPSVTSDLFNPNPKLLNQIYYCIPYVSIILFC